MVRDFQYSRPSGGVVVFTTVSLVRSMRTSSNSAISLIVTGQLDPLNPATPHYRNRPPRPVNSGASARSESGPRSEWEGIASNTGPGASK